MRSGSHSVGGSHHTPGKRHYESGPSTHGALHPYRRSLAPGQLSHYRKTDPRPGHARLPIPLQAGIWCEDLTSLGLRDPFTLILHQ